MTISESNRLCGRFLSENSDDWLKAFHIVMDVKETDKSYIFELVEFESRYSAVHISHLFSKSKRVVLSKSKGGHAIRKWCDGTFTFYPFQAGIPYYFKKIPDMTSDEQQCTQNGLVSQNECLECESLDCAYNRDGTCRFHLVYDHKPNITEDDGCVDFVIRNQFSTR